MKIMLRHLLFILLMGVFVLDSQSLLAAGKSSGGKSSGDRPSREQPSKDRSSGGGKSSGDKPSKETSGGKSSGDKPSGKEFSFDRQRPEVVCRSDTKTTDGKTTTRGECRTDGGLSGGFHQTETHDSKTGCDVTDTFSRSGGKDYRSHTETCPPSKGGNGDVKVSENKGNTPASYPKDSKEPRPQPERNSPSSSYDFSSYESAMQSIKAKEEEVKQEKQKEIDKIQQKDKPIIASLKQDLSKISSDTECFPAHTKVHMADGQFKDIETIQEGDEVVSCHLSGKGECIVSGVKKVIRKTIDRLVLLKTSEGVIEATGNHPFYVYDRESGTFLFKEAKDLSLEDTLVSRHFDGIKVRLLSKIEVKLDHPIPVYNLSLDAVEGDNNYFVGEYGLLVHNCGKRVIGNTIDALVLGAAGQQCFSSALTCMASGMAVPATGGASAILSPESCSIAALTCGALGLSIFSQNHGSDSTKQEEKGDSGKSSSANYPDAKELARQFNIKDVHDLKKAIFKDLPEHIRKQAGNADIGINKAGDIILKNRINGKEFSTDLKIEWYKNL